jgi:hypothetical protein
MRRLEGRQDHPPRARVNGARCRNDPRCLPSSKDRCPATPFRAPGFGLRLRGDLAAAPRTIDAFSPSAGPFEPSRARPPSTRPVASGRRASLGLGEACRLLQPLIDARAHPTSVRPSHASGAFAPLLAGTNGCRLRRFHGALPHPGPASHELFATALRTPRSTRVDRTIRGPKRPSKGERAFLDDSRVPSS